MSTRSLIGIKEDKGITFVYCHFDGYLNGVGTTLVNYYDTEEKIHELLERGDISSLGEDIESCDFYKDRGEDDVNSCLIPTTPDLLDRYYICGQKSWADYVYLFEDGEWKFSVERCKMVNGAISYLPAEWKSVQKELKAKKN